MSHTVMAAVRAPEDDTIDLRLATSDESRVVQMAVLPA
jgi:hypothetical protein